MSFDHIAYFASSIGAAGTTYGLFAAADDALAPEKKRDLSLFLKRNSSLQLASNWCERFITIFDSLFTENHFSMKCFFRSSIASFASVVIIFLLWISTDDIGYEYIKNHIGVAVFPAVIFLACLFNVIPDYLSLLQSRLILSRITSSTKTFNLAVLDILLTTIIAIAAIVVVLAMIYITYFFFSNDSYSEVPSFAFRLTELFSSDVFFLKSWNNDISVGIFFYSTFFTSLWSWLFVLSLFATKVANSVLKKSGIVLKFLNIDEFPLKSIGFVAMLFVFLFFVIAYPIVYLF